MCFPSVTNPPRWSSWDDFILHGLKAFEVKAFHQFRPYLRLGVIFEIYPRLFESIVQPRLLLW